ncbi:MAG: hypothetical protein ACXIUM_14220 [Wenzhouxiangella sp.]
MKLDTNEKDFAEAFIKGYLAPGFGNLPKREIDLLVLQLLVEHDRNLSWEEPPSAFHLAQILGVKRSKIRSLMDELSFRRPATERDETTRKTLRKMLISQELKVINDVVRLQIEDGYCREYAKNLVSVAGGIVDGSFDRTIITLTADKFLILSAEIATDEEQVRLAQILKKETELKPETLGSSIEWQREIRREFLKSIAGQAGKELTSDMFWLGRLLLTGGASELASVVNRICGKVSAADEVE